MAKRGRPFGKLSETARLIFSRLGGLSEIRDQDQLMLVAQVGPGHINIFRRNPEKLEPQLLVRMADAVGANVTEVLESAGYTSFPEDKILEIRKEAKAMKENAQVEIERARVAREGAQVIQDVSHLSAEELQMLVELQKLIGGLLPVSYALKSIQTKRQNKQDGC